MYKITFQDKKINLPLKECRNEMQSDNKLERAYNEHRITEFMTEIESKFGIRTLSALLSGHVLNSLPDSRFDPKVAKWASQKDSQLQSEETKNRSIMLHNIHPVIINSACLWVIDNEKNKENVGQKKKESKLSPNEKLFKKMSAEQDNFRNWLSEQSPQEILNHTYEYTVRQDILYCLEENGLPDEQAKALLKSPCPLADIFKNFSKKETSYMEEIRASIEDRTNSVINTSKEIMPPKTK